jgi:MFS family permease
VLAVALGVGRFAFTPLLPLMLKSGALDIRHGGWLASANYAGYLIGALSCAAIRLDHARMVRLALASTIVLTLAMGLVDNFWLWSAIRFVAGVVSAWAFVFASQWGLRRLAELDAHGLAGVIYAGPGVGIVATGLLGAAAAALGVPPPGVWIGFAVCSGAAGAIVWKAFTHDASIARENARVPRGAAYGSTRADSIWLVSLYSLAGFGYIITATFLPVIARQALPGSSWPDLFWPVFGLALIAGALIAARLPISWDNRLLLAACYVTQALGILLGIVFPTALGFGLGSLLLGLPFTAITLFAMREARRLRGNDAAGLMGYATGAYGLGQIVGPLLAAPIAEHTGSFSIALWIAVLALVLGAAGLGYLGTRVRL